MRGDELTQEDAPPQANALFGQHLVIAASDTDSTGIVYTPRIAHFVVEAVETWFAVRLASPVRDGVPRTVFASLSCTFLAPMRPGDELDTRVALRRIGRSSLGFEIVGLRLADDRLCWMAETVCVFIDGESFSSRPIPAELLDTLRIEADLAVRRPFADRTLGV